jgi:hypothetical protein
VALLDRLAQRRQLRRAAEHALIAAFPQSSDVSAPNRQTNGHVDAPPSPQPPVDHDDRLDADDTPPLGIPLPVADEIYTTPIDPDAGEFSAVRPHRWYASKRGAIGVVVAAVLAIAVTGILLVTRNSDSPTGESTTDSPIVRTTAPPSPASTSPAPSFTAPPTAPPPAPPPPPPPSPSPSIQAPIGTQPYYPPDQTETSEPNMPEINVTRAPFSASPSPMPPPQYDQGDGRRKPHGCCGF